MSFDNYFDDEGLLVIKPENDGSNSALFMGLLRFGQSIKFKDDPEQLARVQGRFNQELDILTYVELVKDKDATVIKQVAHPGIYVRHPHGWGSDPERFSSDQQRSLVIAMGALKQQKRLLQIFWKHVKRFGFYQNKKDQNGKTITPDFIKPSYLGEYLRAFVHSGMYWFAIFYPFLLLADLYVLVKYLCNKTDYHINDLLYILQSKCCMPTPMSLIIVKLIHRKIFLLIHNYGTSPGIPPFNKLYEDVFIQEKIN